MINIFRIADFWSRNSVQTPSNRIDRALLDRTKRLIAGLHVDPNFETVSGSLVVARGRGKSTRVHFCDGFEQPIPESTREACLRVRAGAESEIEHLSCSSELAEIQASVVEKLKLKASKYVDRILAVSVVDPGVWSKDFDGSVCYSGFCDATRLAEKTGVSVIDAWPDRDIAVGGNGKPLDPLATWILHADRNERIARLVNVAIRMRGSTQGYLIPPSDGIDIETPNLVCITAEGFDFVNGLLSLCGIDADSDFGPLLVSGAHDKGLVSRWSKTEAGSPDRTRELLEITSAPEYASLTGEQLLSSAMKWVSETCSRFVSESLDRMEREYLRRREKLEKQISESPKLRVSSRGLLEAYDGSKPMFSQPGKILIDAPSVASGAFVAHLQNQFPNSSVSGCWKTSTGISSPEGSHVSRGSLNAAILGLLHIDQIPANLPKFTGAHQQRILGRLTPGRPNSWRNLLLEMADFEPPSIKLRDAV